MILVFRLSCCAWCQADSNSDLRDLAPERIGHYGTGPDSGIDFGRHLIGIEVAYVGTRHHIEHMLTDILGMTSDSFDQKVSRHGVVIRVYGDGHPAEEKEWPILSARIRDRPFRSLRNRYSSNHAR